MRPVFVSPRFGIAYDVFGTGKTVVRGGWGKYRWNDQVNDYLGTLATSQGLLTYNLPGGNNFTDLATSSDGREHVSMTLGKSASTVEGQQYFPCDMCSPNGTATTARTAGNPPAIHPAMTRRRPEM